MGLGRPISDREAWEKLARNQSFASVVSNAQVMAKQPDPALPDELYLDYSRTGNRDRCQRLMFARSARLVTFALTESLENRGRFLQPLTSTIEAICAERTWLYPAHDGKLNNFYGRTAEPDLRATGVAMELATADYIMGDRLSPETRALIRDQVRRRVLNPVRNMVEGRLPEIHWLRDTHNWNAVCLAGTVAAALALEDSPADRAWFVAAAEQSIRFFLSGFTPDGYCSEGIGYWNYGFGHFLMLGETVRQASSGHLDLLADPAVLPPAKFCLRAEILNGIYPTIADCRPGSQPDPQFVHFICQRFGLAAPGASAGEFAKPAASLAQTMMFSFLDQASPPAGLAVTHPAGPAAPTEQDSPLRTWFKDGGVLICRPSPGSGVQFAAALKGGHNAEHHNHNDVGSFSVVAGKTMVICDPGSEVYTARTFGPHRYDSKVLNSFGHAVPVVAGQLQLTGIEARAVVLRTDFRDESDTLTLDLRSAYRVPELQKLERTFVFNRSAPAALTVRDEVAFSEPKTFETALITWGAWKKISDHELQLTDKPDAVRVKIDTGGHPFKITAEKLDEDVHTPVKPLRLAITLKSPVKSAILTLTMTPAPPGR